MHLMTSGSGNNGLQSKSAAWRSRCDALLDLITGAFPDARFGEPWMHFGDRDIDGAATIWEFFRKFP
jgi:hypothetical protein